jgi:hypothetical protein
MLTRTLAQSLYGMLGAVFLVAGIAVLLLGTGLLPPAVRDMIVDVGRDNGNTLHIMQEFASLLVFVALVTFWFIFHYDQSRPFHWAMTLFWGLFALVHWFDIRGSFHFGLGQLINSIPFVLFLVVGLLRQRADGRPAPG